MPCQASGWARSKHPPATCPFLGRRQPGGVRQLARGQACKGGAAHRIVSAQYTAHLGPRCYPWSLLREGRPASARAASLGAPCRVQKPLCEALRLLFVFKTLQPRCRVAGGSPRLPRSDSPVMASAQPASLRA